MASIKSKKFYSPKFMAGDGCGTTYVDDIDLAAAPSVNDTLEFHVPAGVQLHSLSFDWEDIDSNGSPAFTYKVGYKSLAAEPTLTANDSYFGTGLTGGRTAGRVACSFKPITFNESVAIVVTVTAAAATFAAGNVAMIAEANCVGLK